MSKVWRTISGERPIDGSSIITSLGSSSRPRAISSCFCSPPDRVEACWLAFLRSFDPLRAVAQVRRRSDKAKLDIVAHRKLGEDVAPLRDIAEAGGDKPAL